MWTRLALLCFFCLSALANWSLGPSNNPEETPGFFEGDIDIIIKNGVIPVPQPWPENTVYYKINKTYEEKHKDLIREAMVGIQKDTCVRFKEADKEKNFVQISGHKEGCNSALGYLGGEQSLNLAKGCFKLGIIQHELLHTLGFHHQVSSTDRDQYVLIIKENIQTNYSQYLEIHNETDNFGVPYDIGSIMHFGVVAFSKNGHPTILPLWPEPATASQMGQRDGLRTSDVTRIKNMYKCRKPTAETEVPESIESSEITPFHFAETYPVD